MSDAKQSLFSGLVRTKGPLWDTVEIAGTKWDYVAFSSGLDPRLRRTVPAGEAEIFELANAAKGAVHLTIKNTAIERARIEHNSKYDSLEEAAAAAEAFVWVVREHAGHAWHCVRNDDNSEKWVAAFGPGHEVTIDKSVWLRDHGYSVEHEYSPRSGETYKLSASRYKTDGTSPIDTFEEAVAVACSLPALAAALMYQAPRGTETAAKS